MIEDIKLQILGEKIEAFQESTKESIDKYNDVLLMIDDLVESVDGHPLKSVKMLEELKEKLAHIEVAVCNIKQQETKESKKERVNLIHILMAIFFSALGGFIGLFLYSILFVN